MDKPKTILVGIPSGAGYMPTMMVQSLLNLHKPLPCQLSIIDRQRVDKARNEFVKMCLAGGFDYLFMIDDDNPIPPDTLEKFLEDDKDIVIAPILSRNPNKNGIHDLCAFYSHEHKVDGKKLKLYDNITEFKDEGYLHKIDGAGCGAILIKRKVLEVLFKKYEGLVFEFGDIKFKKPITINEIEYKRRTMSEDCEFSERAIKHGFEIWLDERVKPFHITRLGVVQYNKDKK